MIIPDGSFDERWHDSDAKTAARHNEYLDEFPPPFEVLSDHKSAAVSGHPDTDACRNK